MTACAVPSRAGCRFGTSVAVTSSVTVPSPRWLAIATIASRSALWSSAVITCPSCAGRIPASMICRDDALAVGLAGCAAWAGAAAAGAGACEPDDDDDDDDEAAPPVYAYFWYAYGLEI